MANIIQIKRKTTTGNPAAGVLADGEMVWNEVDEKLLIKTLGVVKQINTAGGGGGGTSLTYNLLTDASVTLSINNIYKLQATTLTANRVLTMPAGTANGDKIKILNANTTAFTVTLAGSSVYFWNETDTLTILDTANYYSFEWFDGKWMIDN